MGGFFSKGKVLEVKLNSKCYSNIYILIIIIIIIRQDKYPFPPLI